MAAKDGGQQGHEGVPYQFVVDVPSTLLCNVCLELCSDPQQAVCCGKLFCFDCIEKAKTRNKDENCPCCRQPIKTFPDRRTEQEIGNLQIVCPNVERGCQERLELRNADEHKSACPFELISCQFSDVGCLKTMLRKEMKDHNMREMPEHLDLCRRMIATILKLEEIQKKIPPLEESSLGVKEKIKKKSSQGRKEEIVVSCQPKLVINIEVYHHDEILSNIKPLFWRSDPFQLRNWKLKFGIDFFTKENRYSKHVLYLQIVENPPRRTVQGSKVYVNGLCEVLVKESGEKVHHLKPFQVTFTCSHDKGWSTTDCVGKISSSSERYHEAFCIVYKLTIWDLAYSSPE